MTDCHTFPSFASRVCHSSAIPADTGVTGGPTQIGTKFKIGPGGRQRTTGEDRMSAARGNWRGGTRGNLPGCLDDPGVTRPGRRVTAAGAHGELRRAKLTEHLRMTGGGNVAPNLTRAARKNGAIPHRSLQIKHYVVSAGWSAKRL